MNQSLSLQQTALKGLRGFGILLCVLVALVSYRYVTGGGFVPAMIAENTLFQPWLLIHVLAAATALLIGPFQFLTARNPAKRSVHRILGRIYAIGCLAGAVSGFMLALGASTGYISTAGFGLLAIAWFVTVAIGWRKAVTGKIADHQEWMIRSFALTLAAVTLRLYLPIAQILPVDFDDAYRAISFLSWVPNVIAAEFFLIRRRAMATSVRSQTLSIQSVRSI